MKLEGVSEKVFLDRYSLKDKDGAPLEKTPEEMWRRVAGGIASVEKKEKKGWEDKFYGAMQDFKFVPGGRVLAGAGTGYAVTFYNCFVIPSPPDSRDGILDNLKAMIEIMARGGGVGVNISSLRPRGARVRKVNGFSSGPCNWAEMYSLATHDIIQQGGCFSADTRIMTHRGLVPIEEIIKSKSNYYSATHQGYQKVTTKFNNGIKDTYEVKTSAGFTVRTTNEHRFLTFDTQGKFYLKELSELKEGESIAHLLGEWSNELPYVILNTTIPVPSKYSSGLKEISLPDVLNEDLAFIVGAYDADGSKIIDEFSPHGKGIRIAVADDRNRDLQRLVTAIQRCFNVTPKLRKGDGAVTIVQVFSRRLNEFLKLNGLLKDSSVTVSVPEAIFTSPRTVVGAYVAGVFLGDGSNRGGKGGLRITTVSHQFAQKLQLLLLNMGIAAKIKTQERVKKNWKTIFTVTVNGKTFMKRFIEILLPYTEKVFDKEISIRDGFFGWPFNVVDRFLYVSHFQRTMARSNPTTSQKAVLFLSQATPLLQEVDRPDVEFLKNCIPDTISSITHFGKEHVYDLEVDNVHLLSGNGFYTSNSRRGALMLMLWDWHPDIEEFITVKQDLRRINGANLSVCVSDTFMEAVKQDSDWDLVFPDIEDPEYDQKWDGILDHWKKLGKKVKVHKTVKARHLWNLICEAAWRSAEPGLVFMERYNKWYNNWYWNTINCVNPCVTGDTLVATEIGWISAKELKPGIKIATPLGLKTIDKVYNNGKQKIFKIRFSDGGELKATKDHKLKVVRNKKYEWVEVIQLNVGDKVVVADNTYFNSAQRLEISPEVRKYAQIHSINLENATDKDFGFLLGVAIGDGYFRQMGKKYGYQLKIALGRQEGAWKKILEDKLALFGVIPSYARYEHQLVHADGTVVTHGSDQLLLYKFANILGLLGLPTKRAPYKEIPEIFFNLSLEFQKGLIDGLFSTDGSLSLKSYDPLLRLTSVSYTLLKQVRLLLLNFGIHSRIYHTKRKKTVYDGRDLTGTGVKYELLVMNEGIAKFYKEIGLSHPQKREKLKKVADEYYFMAGTNLARVEEVIDTGTYEEVFDVHEPETLIWVTNGYVSLDCGEEGLPAWGVCNLASLNLSMFVKGYSVEKAGTFDYKALEEHARIAVRFQDDVVDADQYIYEEIEKMQHQGERRIGLGTLGLGDALIKMHLRYGSDEALPVVDKIYKTIRDAAYDESINIAKEKGAFPKINIKKHLQGYFIKQLPESIRKKMKKYGIRNSMLLQAAPTGTTSLLSGTSSGIEPVYEFEYYHTGRLGKQLVYHHLYGDWKKAHPNEKRPDYFVAANDLTPQDHVKVQAIVQKYVDASISKTVNAPNAHTVEDVKKLYMMAYDSGCKGITYMRDGSRQGVLQRVEEKKEEAKKETPVMDKPIAPRPMQLEGVTYQLDTPVGKTYITINHDKEKQPFEVFITIGKSGSDVAAMADALGRMISVTLRLNGILSPRERIRQVVAHLAGIGGARTVGFGKEKVRSLPDAVAKVLAKHFDFSVNGHVDDKQIVSNGNGLKNGESKSTIQSEDVVVMQQLSIDGGGGAEIVSASTSTTNLFDLCPECGAGSLAYEEGCQKCYSCGYSAC